MGMRMGLLLNVERLMLNGARLGSWTDLRSTLNLEHSTRNGMVNISLFSSKNRANLTKNHPIHLIGWVFIRYYWLLT
jgi:hypothetical protein